MFIQYLLSFTLLSSKELQKRYSQTVDGIKYFFFPRLQIRKRNKCVPLNHIYLNPIMRNASIFEMSIHFASLLVYFYISIFFLVILASLVFQFLFVYYIFITVPFKSLLNQVHLLTHFFSHRNYNLLDPFLKGCIHFIICFYQLNSKSMFDFYERYKFISCSIFSLLSVYLH